MKKYLSITLLLILFFVRSQKLTEFFILISLFFFSLSLLNNLYLQLLFYTFKFDVWQPYLGVKIKLVFVGSITFIAEVSFFSLKFTPWSTAYLTETYPTNFQSSVHLVFQWPVKEYNLGANTYSWKISRIENHILKVSYLLLCNVRYS